MNFEHYIENHNKRFSCRYYCPCAGCTNSYSRRNVLTAHMRKIHGCSETEACSLVNVNQDDKITLHCAICELDCSSFTRGQSTSVKLSYLNSIFRTKSSTFVGRAWNKTEQFWRQYLFIFFSNFLHIDRDDLFTY